MKRLLVAASIIIAFTVASCGNQNGSSTNSPQPADSATSLGTEGQNPTDTGMGTSNSGTPGNMDTAHMKSNTLSDSSAVRSDTGTRH